MHAMMSCPKCNNFHDPEVADWGTVGCAVCGVVSPVGEWRQHSAEDMEECLANSAAGAKAARAHYLRRRAEVDDK